MNKEQQSLAVDNLNLARKEAWRLHYTTGIEYSTLESVSFEGLCKAAYRYDPSLISPTTGKTMKFSSIAVPTIRGELLHWIRDRTYAMRLSHKMRERWVKGRKLLHKGATDLEIAKELEIDVEEWLEVRKVCSGPPLELKEQAKPTEALEPSEINFGSIYLKAAKSAMEQVDGPHRYALDSMEVYLSGVGNKIPKESVDALLSAAGCHATNWEHIEVELVEGWEDLGDGRVQGQLF